MSDLQERSKKGALYTVSCIACGKSFEYANKLQQHLRWRGQPLWKKAMRRRHLAIKKLAAQSGLVVL